ncbi:hypothetical protein BASA81_015875 [Batrachochytrium salamandrivorans]|nr:hypothetical protein BASA81_015875 [Batrachochytrium salamandrivorans]
MMIARCVILLLLVVEVCQASCVLSDEDWTPIRTAYLERNTYNPLKSICNDTLPNSLQSKYGNCQTPLKTVLLNTGLEADCFGHFSSTLYSGLGSNPSTLANTLCNANLKDAITNNFCNALTVVGCPRAVEILQFLPFASCYIAPLANRTTTYQLAYYANQDDLKCMRRYGVCESFKAANWDTSERCELSFERAFLDYCPLPTEFEKNATVIIVMCVIGPFILLALGCIVYRFRRKPHLHHITRNEVLNQAVGNFVSFDQPLKAHPELQAVIAASKFKGVVFDKTTQTWGVLGENKRYTNEKEAAQRAYLNMAKLDGKPGHSDLSSSASTTNVRAFTSMEIGEMQFVVNATPLTPEQKYEMRFQQLVAFYQFWEPEKPDIEEHSRNLLTKHDFDHVVRALKTNTLANTLCNANLKDAITNNFCNALTVVGCPRAVEIIRFSPYANCYIVPLENRTTAYQLAYYANQDDFKCMRKYKAHPELQAVIAASKFKGVVFDKTTQTWGVLGENKRYTNERKQRNVLT